MLWTRRLTDLGIFSGISTGAALAGAVRCASQIAEGVIVVISPDGGWKYLSTRAWSGDLDEAADRLRGTSCFVGRRIQTP